MLRYLSFIAEAGIQHLEHAADHALENKAGAVHAYDVLNKTRHSLIPITRKLDDRLSFHVHHAPDGRVGVKYKGTGSTQYHYSDAEIDKAHGHKPYLAGPLKAVRAHVGKILPHGHFQGGFMSAHGDRHTHGSMISHTPNTITYSADRTSTEGHKLAKSKVSVAIHTRLHDGHHEPITDTSDFHEHPDVHFHNHVLKHSERQITDPKHKEAIDDHLGAAAHLILGHNTRHHAGHEDRMKSYINSTVDTGKQPDVKGYKAHVIKKASDAISKLKNPKVIASKHEALKADLHHIDKNHEHFTRTFTIHHHLQQAANHIARALDSKHEHGFHTSIGGQASGGEGYVAGGSKIVDREGFAKANRARTAILRAKKS